MGRFSLIGAVRRFRGRFLLVLLTLWSLAMVVPDFYRLVHPLGSFGLLVDGDGLVTDVRGPFSDETDSPAWRAGVRPGDRLDLAGMRCIPVDTLRCATALAVLGKVPLASAGRHGELALAASAEKPVREVELVATTRPFSWWVAAVLPFDQIAAILVILAAAWLVWMRPGPMTWGFFLYIIWFNPGQSFQYYAVLQHRPALLLAQNIAGDLAEGAGFAGFLLFALRAPQDRITPRWRPLERALPVVAVLLALLLALSNINVFGYPAETLMRAGTFSGFVVAAAALVLLLARRGEQAPLDYQRLRWVIWGCLIGLPSLTLADLGQQTTFLDQIWGSAPAPDGLWDLVRLINGVLCLFVFEAVRRPVVVNVTIPLRRATILSLLLSAPALFLHHQYEHLSEGARESLELPGWLWLVIATLVVFVISRLHELATHHADRFFHRSVARVRDDLSQRILQAPDFAAIETRLVGEAGAILDLASSAVFRRDGEMFRRSAGASGWDEPCAGTLRPEEGMRNLSAPRPFEIAADVAERANLPGGLARPVFAVPIANRIESFAVALYGPHASGANLNDDERAALAELGRLAGEVWTKLDRDGLLWRIETLQSENESLAAKLAPTPGGR